jgi:hypothetical protein
MNMTTNFTLVEAEVQKLIDVGVVAAVAPLNSTIISLRASVSDLTMKLAACQAQLPAPPPTSTPSTTVGLASPPVGVGCSGMVTAYSGPTTITAPGTIVKDKLVKSSMRVLANNVQFINCRIEFNDYWGIDAEGYSGLVVDHCTMVGAMRNNSCILTGTNWRITNCDLSRMENGIMVQGDNWLCEGNYIHDLGGSSTAHVDGIQIAGPSKNGIVRGNWIESWDTSVIFIKCDFGAVDSIVVEGNTLKNAPGKLTAQTIYSYSVGTARATNITIRNNRMERGNWGYLALQDSTPIFIGNVDYVTGQPI